MNALKLWQKDILALLVLDALTLLHVPIVSDVAWVIMLALFPGVLILRVSNIRPEEVWARIVHMVALSISTVMAGGLFINAGLPLVGILQPLSQVPVFITFNVAILSLIAIGCIRAVHVPLFEWKDLTLSSVTQHTALSLLPVIAVAGAIILNNGGTNLITGLAIIGVVCILLSTALRAHVLKETFILTILYCSSLTLLLTMSMRSWHVIGFDVNQELLVFQMTQSGFFWTMRHFQDAYNACMSITILPTIFSNYLTISNEYVYKFVFQLIFALMPISVFYFFKKYGGASLAFLATILLTGQAIFSHAMPALIRQEFGFLYFALLLLTLFSFEMRASARYTLAGIYGTSIILSHYSTTYIAILLLSMTVVMNYALMVGKRIVPRLFRGAVTHTIPIWFVGFLIAGTVSWGMVITATSTNLTRFIDHSSSNISEAFSYDAVTRALFQTFAPYPHTRDFEKNIQHEMSLFRAEHSDLTFYDANATDAYRMDRIIYPQSAGVFGPEVQRYAALVFQLIKVVSNNLLIIVGMLVLIYQWYSKKFAASEYVLLCASGFLTLALFLVLPGALNQYNIDRLYFQLLMVWSLLSVVAGMTLLSFFKRRLRVVILGVLYSMVLLFYSSLIFVITGGPVFVSLSNSGLDYEKFYVHEGEIYAAQWLAAHHGDTLIFSNNPGFNRLEAFGGVLPNSVINTILPSMLAQDTFVFLTHINTQAGISTYVYNNEDFIFKTPISFLDEHKDIVYTTGVARVYR